MQKRLSREKIWKRVEFALILILCATTLLLDFFNILYSKNELHNKYIAKIVQQGIGVFAAVLLLKRLNIKVFGTPQKGIYLLLGFIVAIDNFHWSSFLNGNMELINNKPLDFLLFGGYCLSVGMFEECIFRGVIFSLLAGQFSKDKNGLWKTYIVSSLIFAVAHLMNGLSFGTVLQVGYTFLTGGLFGFILMKTKNIVCCGFIHALYNFGGLLFETSENMGLGNGVIFDIGTVITMSVISVVAGVFVLYSVKKYTDEEQEELYEKLGIPMKK